MSFTPSAESDCLSLTFRGARRLLFPEKFFNPNFFSTNQISSQFQALSEISLPPLSTQFVFKWNTNNANCKTFLPFCGYRMLNMTNKTAITKNPEILESDKDRVFNHHLLEEFLNFSPLRIDHLKLSQKHLSSWKGKYEGKTKTFYSISAFSLSDGWVYKINNFDWRNCNQ